MKKENDITENLGTLYHPKSALVFYQSKEMNSDMYVEHFDMDKNGNPINAHPLTVNEAKVLAKAFQTNKEKDSAFLKPKGILLPHILYINPSEKGSVLWYTKTQQQSLYFVENLGIPNGKATIPPMLWYASKNSLRVFALASERRPTEKTVLFDAPFFNIYQDGKVCMGTVNINIKKSASLEEFTTAWENYFFNSYFSHLLENYNPIKGNCVSLWKKLIETGEAFPKEILKKTNTTLKDLLQ